MGEKRPRLSRKKKILIGVAALVIGLPAALWLTAAVFFSFLNPVFLDAPELDPETLVSSGREREYLLHVPASHDPTQPTPLVISLHGAMMWPSAQMRTSRWNEVADEHGFLVAYPQGTVIDPPGLPGLPAWPSDGPALAANVLFISDLIDALDEEHDLDPERIYVTGLSNGGGMTLVLACRLSTRIAAVGTVAAANELSSSSCASSKPVPLIAFHGTDDRLVPFEGGRGTMFGMRMGPDFPPVREWIAGWAERNRCAPAPVESVVTANVTRREYRDCEDGAAVLLYGVDGGGHTWPGGTPLPEWMAGATNDRVDASRTMWEFFSRYRRPDE